jgi:hypothetical protein
MTARRPSPGQASLPGAPTAHQIAGRRAQTSGKVGEAIAERLHAVCAREGVAQVWAVSSHLRIVGPALHGALVCRPTGPSVVDCLGVMLDGSGRLVAVEIKHVAEEPTGTGRRLAALRLDLARLKEHQRAHLAGVHQAGGVAVLLVPVSDLVAFAVPWPAVAEALEAGARSLDEDTLRRHQVQPWRPYLARWARTEAA